MAAAAPPSLISREDSEIGTTLYVKMDLAVADKPPETAVFAPSHFQYGADIDIVLYLHGFNIGDGANDIRAYLAKDYGRLREGLAASGANIVLAAPTLGAHSEAGHLVEGAFVDGYLSSALLALRAYAFPHAAVAAPRLRNLILASHSGGGAPMRRLALGAAQATSRLRECWGYDALNSAHDVPDWSQWARRHPDRLLRLFYLANGTPVAERCAALGAAGIANIQAKVSTARDHMHVPMAHWVECLRQVDLPARVADAN